MAAIGLQRDIVPAPVRPMVRVTDRRVGRRSICIKDSTASECMLNERLARFGKSGCSRGMEQRMRE
jgi:hypothetical protein